MTEGIDYKSKDSLAPFQDDPKDDMSLIDLIHIEGTSAQIEEIKAICLRYKKLFRNELGPEPARTPPFNFKNIKINK